MPEKPQSLANHTRLHPLYHLILLPVFFANFIIAIVVLVRTPGWLTAWNLVMAFALFALLGVVRMYPMKVQDRVIRIEERLRLTSLLPDPLRARIYELSERQLIALRFASDKEIPALVQKTLTGHLKPAEIKQAIAEWRSDTWRV
ncbi:MAG TPA: DUF6526 family protein [Acidobacteriaceae bacterium]|nr:DUF6526 family protein [Acidobacteriaceae bacterium]